MFLSNKSGEETIVIVTGGKKISQGPLDLHIGLLSE